MAQEQTSADVIIQNHGSIVLFKLETDEARTWVEENIGGDATYWAGGLVAEPRYVNHVTRGMLNDGLIVHC